MIKYGLNHISLDSLITKSKIGKVFHDNIPFKSKRGVISPIVYDILSIEKRFPFVIFNGDSGISISVEVYVSRASYNDIMKYMDH